MNRMSEKNIKQNLTKHCKMQTPYLWEDIEGKLEPQRYQVNTENNKRKKIFSQYKVVIASVISIIIISFGLLNFNYSNLTHHFMNTKDKIAVSKSKKNNENEKPPIISAGPMVPLYSKWQNGFYGLETTCMDINQVGKCLAGPIYEVKGINPNKSIAVLITTERYYKANFQFNATFAWNDKTYELNPNYEIDQKRNTEMVGKNPNTLNTERIGKYLGKIDSFEIYSIEGTDIQKELAVKIDGFYCVAFVKQ